MLLAVGESHGHRDRHEIDDESTRRFDATGAEPAESEIGHFADQIKRADASVDPIPHDDNDPEQEDLRSRRP